MKTDNSSNFVDLIGKQTTVNSVSDALAKKVESIQKVFDSAKIKKLFNNASTLNKFAEKLKNDKKQDKILDNTKSVTKIDNLQSNDESMVGILTKILTFMQSNYESDKRLMEENQNFAEERKLEKEKRRKELLEALKARQSGVDDKLEKETGEDSNGLWDNLLGAFGGGKTALDIIMKVGKFFLTNPIGIGLLAGATLLTLLYRDKKPEETTKAILNAGKVDGGLSEAIMNVEGVDKHKSQILREAYKSGELKSGSFFSLSDRKKESQQEKKYLEQLGWDPKTGLTDSDRAKGYNMVDDETGQPYYNKHFDRDGNLKSKQETETRDVPTSAIPSEPTAISTETTPTSLSESATPTSDTAMNLGSKLNQITGENIDNKLMDEITPQLQNLMSSTSSVINNMMGSSGGDTNIPTVRNQEETFQRMIWESTRLV